MRTAAARGQALSHDSCGDAVARYRLWADVWREVFPKNDGMTSAVKRLSPSVARRLAAWAVSGPIESEGAC